MSDPHDPVGVAKPAGWFWWLAGRASRREYWIYIAMIFALAIGLGFLDANISAATTVLLVFAQIRRAHDLDRSGWWAAGATFAPVAVMLPLLFLGLFTATLIGTGLELGLLVLFGVLPGTAGDNRFGPPPRRTLKYMLSGR